jgi:riboflavin synthase
MYSGITCGLFEATQVDKKAGLITYSIKLNHDLINGLEIGASVAIDGVCQTVVSIVNNDVTFDAMAETLERTTLNDLYVGRKVSVEKSLRFGDVVGGHEVAGHVIGTAEIINRQPSENNLSLVLRCPKEWLKYILIKGFIAVDGSSLTIGETDAQAGTFVIHLIPETLRVTNFGNKHIGDRVNIELDFKTQAIVDTVERVLQNNFIRT